MISKGKSNNEVSPLFSSPEEGKGRIADKVVLIIGGVTENGRALASDLAEQGAHVALVYGQQSEAEAQATKREVEAHERECLLIPSAPDKDARKFARSVVQQVVDELGRLDIFIEYGSPVTVDESAGEGAANGPKKAPVFPGVGMLVAAMNQISNQA